MGRFEIAKGKKPLRTVKKRGQYKNEYMAKFVDASFVSSPTDPNARVTVSNDNSMVGLGTATPMSYLNLNPSPYDQLSINMSEIASAQVGVIIDG